MKRILQTICCLFAAVLFTNCATPRQAVEYRGNKPISPEELVKWCTKNGLAIASEKEVALAKQCEARFVGQQAVAVSGGLRIVFKLGKLVGSGYSNLSTTSTYSLLDGNHVKLAEGPSCIRSAQVDRGNEHSEQRVWFAPDGKMVVLYEYTNEGLGPEPLTLVFYEDKESPGLWRSKFLRLPFCDWGFWAEGAHTECQGFVGDELLFKGGENGGRILKKKVSEIEEHYPFPFTIG